MRRVQIGAVVAGAAIAVAVACCYANTFGVPFIFDDQLAIAENPNIRHLWPIAQALRAPPRNATIGRPVASLSLAVNYAISGLHVWSYHAVNLAVHLLATLALFGVFRRTLLLPGMAPAYRGRATGLAGVTALLWGVHPLQTESVTYISNRTESMMGLLLLATLYCAAHGLTSCSPRRWHLAAVGTCLLGMGCKEVMVAAPLLVLLYDRCFAAGCRSVGKGARRGLHLGLMATWAAAAVALAAKINLEVGRSAGFHFAEPTPVKYAAVQCGVLLHYLKLVVWPRGLIVDYASWPMAGGWAHVAPQAALWLAVAGATVWGLVRRWRSGFLGAWFLLILAPTSSILPLPTEIGAERRMYLPLAAVIAAVVLAADAAARRLQLQARLTGFVELGGRGSCRAAARNERPNAGASAGPRCPPSVSRTRGCLMLAAGLVAAGALGLAAVRRNYDYRSDVAIWSDTVLKQPGNARGRLNLANAMVAAGQTEAGLRQCVAALDLGLRSAAPHMLMGHALLSGGQRERSWACVQRALAAEPACGKAHILMGDLLLEEGRLSEAAEHYEIASFSAATMAVAYNNLSAVCFREGRFSAALEYGLTALHLEPDLAEAHIHVANALRNLGRLDASLAHCTAALRLRPNATAAHVAMGVALAEQGRLAEAIAHFREGLRIDPDSRPARHNLEVALTQYKEDPR